MILTNRVLFSDNGVLSDLSVALGDYRAGASTIGVIAAQDYLYIGSDLPFNHRYVEVSSVNALASVLSVELWDGSSWVAAVDVIDETAASGASLAQSGHVSWKLKKTEQWKREDSENIPALSTLTIYDLYWARFKWSADLTGTTALSFVGQVFSEDLDLTGYWPELTVSSTYSQWPAQPKTTWKEQHFEAAETIVRDLKKKEVLINSNQILNWELFREAGAHKAAEIIMNAFGKDYAELRDKAAEYYDAALTQFYYQLDQNRNTRLDENEKIPSISVIRR